MATLPTPGQTSRRRFLQATAVLGGGLLAAACGGGAA